MVRAYERLDKIPVHKVLRAIANRQPIEHEGIICYTSGTRLLTYHVHGMKCCVPGCAISGEFFAIEKTVNQPSAKWHLNLYGMRHGQEVMLTSDHRLPKSKGGLDVISNRQPMCMPHNFQKGNQLIHL